MVVNDEVQEAIKIIKEKKECKGPKQKKPSGTIIMYTNLQRRQ